VYAWWTLWKNKHVARVAYCHTCGKKAGDASTLNAFSLHCALEWAIRCNPPKYNMGTTRVSCANAAVLWCAKKCGSFKFISQTHVIFFSKSSARQRPGCSQCVVRCSILSIAFHSNVHISNACVTFSQKEQRASSGTYFTQGGGG
jgi:hypothetical protein